MYDSIPPPRAHTRTWERLQQRLLMIALGWLLNAVCFVQQLQQGIIIARHCSVV